MRPRTIALSVNASWNVVNFRLGLIKSFQEAGCRVAALSPMDACSSRLVEEGVTYLPLAMNQQGTSPFQDLALMHRYYMALRRLKPDVYLGFTAKPNIYGSLAAHLLRIPVINNVSGLGTAFIKGGLLSTIVQALYKGAFARSRVVFFQNPDDMADFVAGGIVPPAVARLLPGSGINLRKFTLAAPPGRKPAFTFLLVARLLWDKGVGEYVEAARMLRAHNPNLRFQILGPVGVANRTSVTTKDVEAWQRDSSIEYLGNAEDVRPFIAAADCIVLPSYREGLPRVLLEGAAMGRPLIATDVPGCRAVVDDGSNGYLCAPRDAGALAATMAKMAQLPSDSLSLMAAAARRKVEQHFSEDIVIANYAEAVEEILGRATQSAER